MDTLQPLPQTFRKNDLTYTILERTSTRYFARLTSSDTGHTVAYESGRIITQSHRTAKIAGKPVTFQAREMITSNESFGKDPFDYASRPENKRLAYNRYLQGVGSDLRKLKTSPDRNFK